MSSQDMTGRLPGFSALDAFVRTVFPWTPECDACLICSAESGEVPDNEVNPHPGRHIPDSNPT